MRINNKPLTRATRRLARVIDTLSKNTLADILLDRIGAEIGEEASDEKYLETLQPWLDVIARLRGDKPVNLLAILKRLDASDAKYLAEMEKRKGQDHEQTK